jgi:hypothetical protein
MPTHTTYCEGTGINPRGESFIEYLLISNMTILNQGNKPIFVVLNKEGVADLTLGTKNIGNQGTGMYFMNPFYQGTNHILSEG